jgi:hypothetical protein
VEVAEGPVRASLMVRVHYPPSLSLAFLSCAICRIYTAALSIYTAALSIYTAALSIYTNID